MLELELEDYTALFARNNEAPSDEVVSMIRHSIRKPTMELASIETEIHELQSRLEKLHGKQVAIKQALKTYNDILSPVRRLPLDVLCEIFTRCLPTERNPTMSAKDAPLLLMHVCKSWREATLSFPELWSTLHIPYTEGNPQLALFMPQYTIDPTVQLRSLDEIMNQRRQIVRDWLNRSGNSPLSLSISYIRNVDDFPSGPSDTPTQSHAGKMLSAISSSMDRWKVLDFDMTTNIFHEINHLASLNGSTFPWLQSLRVFSRPINQEMQEFPLMKTLFLAPRLRRLALEGRIYGNAVIFPPHLTDLYYDCDPRLSHEDIMTLLRRCPSLVHCNIVGVACIYGQDSFQHTDLVHPTLESLCLLKDDPMSLKTEELCKHLHFPNLKWLRYSSEIVLVGLSQPADVIRNSFAPLSLIQKTNIQRLSIQQRGIYSQDILKVLQASMSTTHLEIGLETTGPGILIRPYYASPDITPEESENFDLELLVVDSQADSNKILLPNLLVFEAHWVVQIRDETVERFIISRLDTDSKLVSVLRSVRISFSRPMQKDIAPEILQYSKMKGIELELDLAYRVIPLPDPQNPRSVYYNTNNLEKIAHPFYPYGQYRPEFTQV